jgi:hypothetical protein
MEPIGERPSTIHTEDGVTPKGPWRFLAAAAPGGFSAWGLHLMAAWVALQLLTSLGLALRLGSAVGGSRVADGWGEAMSAQSLWEVMAQGGPAGPWPIVATAAATVALLWTVWAGWKVQAGAAGLAARIRPLLLSLPAALCVGLPPLLALHALLQAALGLMASSGIQFLGWAEFICSPLLRVCLASSLLVQWWLCRIDMAHRAPRGPKAWTRHAKESFLRLWGHPVQWGAIIFLGASLRLGLSLLALLLAWHLGGQTLPRLLAAQAAFALAAAANAWTICWTLRASALYWKNDAELRAVIGELEAGGG